MRRASALGLAVAVALLSPAATHAAEPAGAADHPMISRYEGSEIIAYAQKTFDAFPLLTSAVTVSGGIEKNPAAVRTIEGRVVAITYRSPAERTTLEVFRNYEQALADAGFDTLFSCANANCGGRRFSHAVANKGNYNRIGESYGDQRYLAARLAKDGREVYVSLYVAMASVGGGPDHRRAITQLAVVEVEAMQDNMVTVDADAMAKGILEEGHIALYGIHFDHDSATIKPESDPTLAEIATLLERSPGLRLVVVGHTDSRGGFDYNMDLSRRRAEAVQAALVSGHGVAAERLSAWGAGYLAPVASNQTEAGRAKNRRVVLVEQ